MAALITFVVQNTEPVEFRFLFLRFSWPVWLYTVITALLGALVWRGLRAIRHHRRQVRRRQDQGIFDPSPGRSFKTWWE